MSGQCIIVVGCRGYRCTTMFVNGLMMLLFHFCCRLAEEEEEVGRDGTSIFTARSNAQLSIVRYQPVDKAWLITTITFWERSVEGNGTSIFTARQCAKSNAQLSIVWYHPVDNAWLITMITFWERFVVVHIFCWFIVFFSF